MRIRVFVPCLIAAAASFAGTAHAQVTPRNVVVTPRVLTSDTPRFHHFTVDDSVTTCTKAKPRKRNARADVNQPAFCGQDQKF
jgi:hypothetical protein